MKVIVVGPGAFGIKHLDGLKNIDDAEVVGLVGRNLEKTQAVANEYGIPNVYTSLDDALESDADAVILCTPTQQHAAQSIQCMILIILQHIQKLLLTKSYVIILTLKEF